MNISDHELELLITDIHELYGYDFSNYARASLKRRFSRLCVLDKFLSFAEFRFRVINDPGYRRRLVEEVTVNVTDMFRDPEFFRTVRSVIVPVLATYPVIRIWHAGASTGEEVLSMAILLHEAGLLHKSVIYATDVNETVLESARKGIVPLKHMKQYSESYIAAGGMHDFSGYYTARYEHAKFADFLLKRVVFSSHNLVSDGVFNEFNMIVCRNVLIYFDKFLQERVFRLFHESLEMFGFLALGAKETLQHAAIAKDFRQVKFGEKIWRKISEHTIA